MENEQFEWDDAKAEENFRKHGVDFDAARAAFADPLAVEELEVVNGEERTFVIAQAGTRLLAVVYTERGERLRIISARQATRREHDRYYFENSQE